MRHKENIAQKVEQALNSLDGAHKASPGPFFFTRVQARLQKQRSNGWELVSSFITRPSVALSGLCIIILLNVVAFYFRPAGNGNALAVSGAQNEPVYADDYSNLSNNFFYDETPEP
jgi:hypothetical protein